MSLGHVHRKFWKDLSLVQLDEQIQIRLRLIEQMIGSLYPRILYAEIEELAQLKQALSGSKPKSEVWPWP